ncbi:hypothetical protein [Gracilimonas mengyeensis]|nr:hypothetical protein [Gracilimonas mengyeensis]
MKPSLILIVALAISSCAKETQQSPDKYQEKEIDEMVDIRISSDDQILFNGNKISESSLYSHIQNVTVSEDTRARIIFDENVPIGTIMHTQELLYKRGVKRMYAKGFSTEEFSNYDEQVIHIDILDTNKLLFDGNLLYPEDLEIALSNKDLPNNMEIVITVSENATFGAVYDVQKLLAVNDLDNISNQDFTEYQY